MDRLMAGQMSRDGRASEPASGVPAPGATSTMTFTLLVGLWLIGVATGFTILWKYKRAPGTTDGLPPAVWPAAGRLERTPRRATLPLFAPPAGGCTRASTDGFAGLLPPVHDGVRE